uniref:Saposin B-type domain-containing protein n=1 Tax=Sexangularia sp. CB-2014 TaxID=1486929 RepID=A0A7S1VLR5_9EUKA
MKFLFALFCLLAVATPALAEPVRAVPSTLLMAPPREVAPKEGALTAHSWCGTCVSFFSQAINQLLNIILNVGVLGECSQLCGKLESHIEAEVCNVLCDVVGIEAFVKLVTDEDPDPIYYCEMLSFCGESDSAAANITALTVSPDSGAQNTEFTIDIVFAVTSPIGTGELVIDIVPPGGAEPFGTGNLLVDVAAGEYRSDGKFKATPSEQEPFSPGTYQLVVTICEGSCGSIHPHSKTLTQHVTTFKITGQ